jgi:hypothetical protein
MARTSTKQVKTPILDTLDGERARIVLYQLIRDDPSLAPHAEAIARTLLERVEIQRVADALSSEIEAIKIEEIWDSSGRQRDGPYIYPSERAYEMIEEIVEEYMHELRSYVKRGMAETGREYCKGIILGLWHIQTESHADIHEELPDGVTDFIETVIEEWEKMVSDPDERAILHKWMEQKGILYS